MGYRHVLSFSLLALLFAACKNQPAPAVLVNSDTVPVRLMAIERVLLQQQVEAAGQFTTEDETYLSFKTGGIIQQVLVREGDLIQQGQLLAKLNPLEIQAQVEQATVALEKAQRDFTRAEHLYLDSVATLEQLQNSQSALSIARQQFQVASFNLQYTEIRAGRKGIVLKKMAQEGQIVGPGTPIVQVNGAGKSPWMLKVFVSEADWSRLRKGDPAVILSNGQGQSEIKGRVHSLSEGVDPVTGTLWINIKPDNNIPEKLAAGIFGKAVITPTSSLSGWRIPYDALLEGDGQTGYVFTTRDMKTAHKTQVRVGQMENGYVAITGGLESDQHIIIAGNAYLSDKSPIRISQ
jgi:RND family efflux transporter MFP subunit